MGTQRSRSSRSLALDQDEAGSLGQFTGNGATEPKPKTPYEAVDILDRKGVKHRYITFYIPAGKAFDLSLEILEVAGSELDALGELQGKTELATLGVLAESVSGIAKRLLKRGGHAKALEILSYTKRDGKQLQEAALFQRAYTGNMLELYKALAWVIRVNYADFFEAALGSFGQETEAKEQPSESKE